MSGLNMEPGQSYSIVDRFICDKCGVQPEIVAGTKEDGSIVISAACHGEKMTGTYTKSQLVFTQRLFKKDE